MNLCVIANVAGGGLLEPGLSGGDRIAIECVRRWSKAGLRIRVFTTSSGLAMYKRYGCEGADFILTSKFTSKKSTLPFLLLFEVVTLLRGAFAALKVNLRGNAAILSTSDFLPDTLPALIIKLRNPSAKWVGSFYLFAPNPMSEQSPYRGMAKLSNFFIFLSQAFAFGLLKRQADMLWVTNDLDRQRVLESTGFDPSQVLAVKGGVDIHLARSVKDPEHKLFEGVFIGRLHPQKGIMQMLDVWERVCEQKSDAKLAVIGSGSLDSILRREIVRRGLNRNVTFFGFKDGVEKIKIFKQSKIVVHPATFDSGGMAACEAMVCGLPGVSFDLAPLREYYPKGMLKTPCYDLATFTKNILRLLDDETLYEETARDALDLAKEWDWDKKAKELLRAVEGLFVNFNSLLHDRVTNERTVS